MTSERKEFKSNQKLEKNSDIDTQKELILDENSPLYKHLQEQFELETKLRVALQENKVTEASELLSLLKSEQYPYFDINNSSKGFDHVRMIFAKKLKDHGFLTIGDISLLLNREIAFGAQPFNNKNIDAYIGKLIIGDEEPSEESAELARENISKRKDEIIDPKQINYDSLKLIPFLNEYIKSAEGKKIDPKIIKLLLENGAEPDRGIRDQHSYSDDYTKTPLMLLFDSYLEESFIENKEAYNKYIEAVAEIVNLLIDNKADLNQKDEEGRNILFYSCQRLASRYLFDFLLQHGAEVVEYGKGDFGKMSLFQYAKKTGFKNENEMKKYLMDFYRHREQSVKDATGLIPDVVQMISREYFSFFKPNTEKKSALNELLSIWEKNKDSLYKSHSNKDLADDWEKLKEKKAETEIIKTLFENYRISNSIEKSIKDFITFFEDQYSTNWPDRSKVNLKGQNIIKDLESFKNFEKNNFDKKTKGLIDKMIAIISNEIKDNVNEVKHKK